MLHATYSSWYRAAGLVGAPVATRVDVDLGARCMIELMGGDPLKGSCPPGVDPAIARHLQRCITGSELRVGAWEMLSDFDHLIDVLWGQRTFRVLEMPPKRRA